MASTTHSESRAWEPEPDVSVDPSMPDLVDHLESPETAAADQVAMAAYADAWTRTTIADREVTITTHSPGRDESVGATRPDGSVAPQTESRGVPGRGVIVMSAAACVLVVLIDFALTGGVSMFFDLWFVVVCLVGAMAIRRQDLFTAGVLAPLLFGGLIAVISLLAPSTFSDTGGFGTVFPTGLTAHAGALVAGYGVALLTVACRLNAKP